MLWTPCSTSTAFLRSAFGLTALNPAGVRFGARYESGPTAKPLISNRDGAWLFFEEMTEAVEKLVAPGQKVFRALEPTEGLADLSRRLYLDNFKTGLIGEGQILTRLTATEYRRLSPYQYIDDGKCVSIQGLRTRDRLERLEINYSYSNPAMRLQQQEGVAFLKKDPIGDVSEISIQFRRNDFLRRLVGLREKGVVPSFPWRADQDSPREFLDLALALAGLFYLSDRVSLRKGFLLGNAKAEDDLSLWSGPFIPENESHSLTFDASGQPQLEDPDGRKAAVSDLALDAPSHVISSLATQEIAGFRKPVLTIGWNQNGFRIDQRRALSSGLAVFPTMAELMTLGQSQVDADLAAFESLNDDKKIGLLAFYYFLLANEKHAEC